MRPQFEKYKCAKILGEGDSNIFSIIFRYWTYRQWHLSNGVKYYATWNKFGVWTYRTRISVIYTNTWCRSGKCTIWDDSIYRVRELTMKACTSCYNFDSKFFLFLFSFLLCVCHFQTTYSHKQLAVVNYFMFLYTMHVINPLTARIFTVLGHVFVPTSVSRSTKRSNFQDEISRHWQ